MCGLTIGIGVLEAYYWLLLSGSRAVSCWSAPGPPPSGPFAFTSGTASAWFPQKRKIDFSTRIGRFLSDNGTLRSSLCTPTRNRANSGVFVSPDSFAIPICIFYTPAFCYPLELSMRRLLRSFVITTLAAFAAICISTRGTGSQSRSGRTQEVGQAAGAVLTRPAMHFDVSRPLASMREPEATPAWADCEGLGCGTSPGASADGSNGVREQRQEEAIPPPIPPPTLNPAEIAIEQTSQGARPAAPLLESFDGLGAGFEGPQGTTNFRNPSDNSLAVGPNHILQIVNSRIAIYSKRSATYSTSGTVLYGAVATKSVWTGFGGACEARNNGDAVVRYDQLAERWLIVMPIFSRIGPDEFPRDTGPVSSKPAPPGQLAKSGKASTPGAATALPANPPQPPSPPERGQRPPEKKEGVWAMCYAVSTGPDPLGTYYRYAFERTLFPDYPRPAVWTDGYYTPTSTGDDVIQKHTCIADRAKMLAGQPATEQCIVIDGVNFLNNADIDGRKLPPPGAPNIMMATGGTQLKKILNDDGIYAWKVHVDWEKPANTNAGSP